MNTRLFGAALAASILACSDATGPQDPVGSVFMPASVSVIRAMVAVSQDPAPVWLEFANSAGTAATVGFGVCAFAVEGYTKASLSGRPAWVRVLPVLGGCGPDILYSFEVAASSIAGSGKTSPARSACPGSRSTD